MKYKNLTRYDIDRLLDFLTRKFDGEETVAVCQSDAVLEHFSTAIVRMDSLIVKGPIDSTFTIYVRKNLRNIEKVVCHEFVHLMQLLRGDLAIDEKIPLFYWKGREYDAAYPYDWRPWEKEAFNRQHYLLREYKKSIKH